MEKLRKTDLFYITLCISNQDPRNLFRAVYGWKKQIAFDIKKQTPKKTCDFVTTTNHDDPWRVKWTTRQ